MKKLFFFVLAVLIVACNKPEPNPELRDPIYSDIEMKLKAVEADIATEEKNLADADGEIKKAVPQTGQIKFARKHYFDVKANLEKLRQTKKYYSLRLKSRKDEAEESYLTAFDKKEPWPNPQDFEDYKVQESARTKKRTWSVKERIAQEKGLGLGLPKAGGGEGEGGGEAPAKGGH